MAPSQHDLKQPIEQYWAESVNLIDVNDHTKNIQYDKIHDQQEPKLNRRTAA